MNPEWTCPNCNHQGYACHITHCKCGRLTTTGTRRKIATDEKVRIRDVNVRKNETYYYPSTNEQYGARTHWSNLEKIRGAHRDCELSPSRGNKFCFAPTDLPAHHAVVKVCDRLKVPLLPFPVSSKVVVQTGCAIYMTLPINADYIITYETAEYSNNWPQIKHDTYGDEPIWHHPTPMTHPMNYECLEQAELGAKYRRALGLDPIRKAYGHDMVNRWGVIHTNIEKPNSRCRRPCPCRLRIRTRYRPRDRPRDRPHDRSRK